MLLILLGLYTLKLPHTFSSVEASNPPANAAAQANPSDSLEAVPLRLEEAPLALEAVASFEEEPEPEAEQGLATTRYLELVHAGFSEVFDNTWRAKKIRFRGNYFLSERQLVAWIQRIQPGAFSYARGEVIEHLLAHPWIEDVEITPSVFPFEMDVKIREAKPWLVVEFEGGTSWLLSREGVFLQSLDTLTGQELVLHVVELPRVRLSFNAENPGEYSDAQHQQIQSVVGMIRFLELAGGPPVSLDRYEVSQDGALILVPKDRGSMPRVIAFPRSLEEAERIRKRVLLVVDDSSKRGEVVESIDLRFRGQAVVSLREVSERL